MERSQPTTARSSQSPRVLACVHCQQRKVKCDRRFPCGNCLKHRVQCVPATKTRPRKRRFPERELLDRLRKYESLLRKNNVRFEPLHKENKDPDHEVGGDSGEEQSELDEAHWPSPATATKSKSIHEAKDVWQVMGQGFDDTTADSVSPGDSLRESALQRSWDPVYEHDGYGLLGSREAMVDLATFHPEPVLLFRLWQIYLDNVNPLLKVTHAPSFQARVIEAASDLSNIDPNMEALMFSIYCISIFTLSPDQCQTMLGSSKEDLAAKYQFGCQQALLSARFLRTNDRDCLTALFLFLIAIHPATDPRSLSSLFGIAVRTAQRMGIHSESALARYSVFEAEMRRRLWWSLVLIDTRFGELSDSKDSILAPTWDCKVPLNVNESDLHIDMKESPRVQGKASDALFSVLLSEVGDFLRHAPFHLDFTNPAFKAIAKEIPKGDDLNAWESIIESEYLAYCDLGNPLHFMATWTTYAKIAKSHLMEGYARSMESSRPLTDAQRNVAIQYAFRILEADTKVMSSHLTIGFRWFLYFHFPFPAYIHIVQDLIQRPTSSHAEQAWKIMNDNYDARFTTTQHANTALFRTFSKVILQAWAAFESVSNQSDQPISPPTIVSSIGHRMAAVAQVATSPTTDQGTNVPTSDVSLALSMPTDFQSNSLTHATHERGGFLGAGPGALFENAANFLTFEEIANSNYQNWAAMVSNLRQGHGQIL